MSAAIPLLIGTTAGVVGCIVFIVTRDYLDAATKWTAVRRCLVVFAIVAVVACVLVLAFGGDVAVPVVIAAGLLLSLFNTVRRRRTVS